ncbi:MAG: hypothetical protein ACXWL9_09685 [Syntrophales bacterium]
MAVVCHICKEEVELINFGNGLVGVCCDTVLYNSADKSQFDMKPDEKKAFQCTRSTKKEGLIKQNIPDHER